MALFKNALLASLITLSVALPYDGSSSMSIIERDNSTLHVQVELGSNSFDIGDQDDSTFLSKFIQPSCSATGCDSGSPQSFTFVTESLGFTADGTATIKMSGTIDGDNNVLQLLLNTVNTAMLQSKQCTTIQTQECANNPQPSNPSKRESAGVALGCHNVKFAHCTLVNFIQVTLFDASSDVKAQMSFSGSADEPSGFDCNSFLGPIQGVLGTIPLPDIAEGVISVLVGTCVRITYNGAVGDMDSVAENVSHYFTGRTD
ncbi:hypothetical protein BGZ57DRAFT_860318 [Hyaloscypha finlandica]|nr:hypothetical protein BGZ57DRAFT_860318 [Hyaloscypha finlandica]